MTIVKAFDGVGVGRETQPNAFECVSVGRDFDGTPTSTDGLPTDRRGPGSDQCDPARSPRGRIPAASSPSRMPASIESLNLPLCLSATSCMLYQDWGRDGARTFTGTASLEKLAVCLRQVPEFKASLSQMGNMKASQPRDLRQARVQ